MATVKILIIPGSLRTGSLNARLAAVVAKEFALANVGVTRLSLDDYPLPIYDGDVESKSGVPKSALNLERMMSAHHGIVFVTPEYNSSLPPLLKNAIDWVTRVEERGRSKGQVFRERAFAMASASEGRFGGSRCLSALRLILSSCRATVIPNQLALSFAGEAYDDAEKLKHKADADALRAMVTQLIDVAQHMTRGA
jgi:chromate reductase